MITYKSTRGRDKKTYSFSEAVMKGLAEDGGLLVPSEMPTISLVELQKLANSSYAEKAEFIFNKFQTDFDTQTIHAIVTQSYGTNFDTGDIAPVVQLKDRQYLLELWHGPTSAFKDMALQIMPLFFSEAVRRQNNLRIQNGQKPLHYLILVATSGDTGKAALEGYKDKEGITIFVFYPDKRVSKLQELQMVTQEGNNVGVFAVNGDFDAAQSMVKDIFNDEAFNKTLASKHNILLSSANSINWGRLLPQVVYYVSAYVNLAKSDKLAWGETIDIIVPTGNFGNILAAYIAKKMGVPIGKLICASNANNVLTDFLQTGTYDIANRTLVQTPSPSMDILIASNIERLLYFITMDVTKVAGWLDELKKHNQFTVDDQTKQMLSELFTADWITNERSLQNVKQVFEETGYLMDTHTSVAQLVANTYARKTRPQTPMLICSTAHWAKFAKDIYAALFPGKADKPDDEFVMLQAINAISKRIQLPPALAQLQNMPIRHKKKCEPTKDTVEQLILQWAEWETDHE